MKALRRPLVNILKRRISTSARLTQSATQDVATVNKNEKTLVQNVHYYESDTAINRLSIIYNAGSRYEDKDTLGVTHAIRSALCLGESSLIRKIETTGNLSCTTSRDHFTYTFEATMLRQDMFSALFEAADDAVRDISILKCNPAEIKAIMRNDLAVLHSCPNDHVIELIHRAAYRYGGLGNSLYAPAWAIDKINFDMINDYANSMFNFDNLHMVSTGIDIDALKDIASDWTPASGKKFTPPASKYAGGDIRLENGHDTVHVAVCMEGLGLNSNDKLVQRVLQHIMGTTQRVKYNPHTSKLSKAVFNAAPSSATSCFNMQYSDTGLFGFQVAGNYREIGAALKAGMTVFGDITKGKVSDEDVNRAKKCLLVELLETAESDRRLHEKFSAQVDRNLEDWEIRAEIPSGQTPAIGQSGAVASKSSLHPQAALIEAVVNKITKAQVEAVAKKLFTSKPSMAAIGNLRQLPYLDDLF